MILTGAEDIRVKKTVSSIRESFMDLIAEKAYEKITVKEVCDKAMINKKTFYVYFASLEDLLADVMDSFSSPYSEQVKDFVYPRDIAKGVRAFFEFSAKQNKAYERITCASSLAVVRERMISHVVKNSHSNIDHMGKTNFENAVLGNFIHDTILAVYTQWIAEKKKTPLEDVIRLTTKLITKGMSGV